MKLEKCIKCGEETVEVIKLDEGAKSVCHNCDHEIENITISDEEEEEDVYAECPHCGSDFNVFDDNTNSGMCEECREAYSALGDDELMENICSEFNVYPYEVEYDRTYNEMEISGVTYEVYTDETIVELVKEYIQDTLWAFNPYFLACETGIDSTIFEVLANSGECESLNEGIRDIIEKTCGMDEFVESAISEDGISHFLNDEYTTVESSEGTLYLG